MRKSLLLTLSAMVLSAGVFAQTLLRNDGAMLVVEPGATLVVEGGVENVNGGTINNDGTIEIQGNFLNSAIWENGPQANTVIFSGTLDANVTPGSAIFNNVQMNKASGGDITLLGAMSVTGALTFNAANNKIFLGGNNLTVTDPGSIVSFDADEYVVTNGAGYLRKEGLGASETFTFPVGYNATTYNPAVLAANVGHTNDVFSVRALENVLDDGLAGAPLTKEAVAASWEINEGTATGSNVNVTLQWLAPGDELMSFDRTMSAVSRHDGSGWTMLFSELGAAAGANPYTRTKSNVNTFTTPSVFGVGSDEALALALQADLMAYLEAVYVSGTNTQSDFLRAGGLVPVTEPYTGLGYAYEGFGGAETTTLGAMDQTGTANDAVDWIVVELRSAVDNTLVVASRAGILQRDGDIVSEDGSSMLQIFGVAAGNYYVALQFRNHLGVMTASPVSFASMGVFDFTTATIGSIYNGVNAVKQAADGKNILIRGDANNDDLVNNTDLTVVAPQSALGVANIYGLLDTNMDGLINNTDLVTMAPNAAIGYSEQVPD